jgi:hypothetical protein
MNSGYPADRGEGLPDGDCWPMRLIRSAQRKIWLDDGRRLSRRVLGGLSDFGDYQACE